MTTVCFEIDKDRISALMKYVYYNDIRDQRGCLLSDKQASYSIVATFIDEVALPFIKKKNETVKLRRIQDNARKNEHD